MCCFLCGCNDEESPLRHRQQAKRGCTDVCALLLFFLFCIGLGCVAGFGFIRGDVYRIWYGADSFGNTCGRENGKMYSQTQPNETFPYAGRDMRSRKFMFAMNITRPLDTVWICVNECPQETLLMTRDISVYARDHNTSLCVSDEESLNAERSTVGTYGACPMTPVFKSVSVLNRCIPEDILKVVDHMTDQVVQYIRSMDFVRSYVMDIGKAFPVIAQMMGLAFVFSFLMILLLRLVAPIVVYFVYLMVVAVFAGISGSLWYALYLMHLKPILDSAGVPDTNSTDVMSISPTRDPTVTIHSASIFQDFNVDEWFRFENTSSAAVLGLAIGASVITIFSLFVVWCLIPRGQLVVDLFKRASTAVFDMPLLLLQPILTALSIVVVAFYSLGVIMLLYTAGEPSIRYNAIDDGNLYARNMVEYNATTTTKYLMFYQFVGFVWLSEFLMGCQRMLIAGAVSIWYFDSTRRNLSAVCSSFHRLIRYHLGSVALGSFIITLVRVPRYILMYILAKMKATENVIVKKLLACCICTLGCIEACLRYITSNAYTVIAYSGQSFCPACKTATNVILDNAVNLATINSVGYFVIFLSKLTVASSSAAVAMFRIKNRTDISHNWLPVLVVFIIAYQIANCFLSVYEMAIDTLFMCYAEDVDLSQKTDNADYYNEEMREYMTETLQRERKLKSPSRSGGKKKMDSSESYPLRGVSDERY